MSYHVMGGGQVVYRYPFCSIDSFFSIYTGIKALLYHIVHLNKAVNTWVSSNFTNNVSGGIPSQDTLLLNWLATETSRLTFLKLKMF